MRQALLVLMDIRGIFLLMRKRNLFIILYIYFCTILEYIYTHANLCFLYLPFFAVVCSCLETAWYAASPTLLALAIISVWLLGRSGGLSNALFH